ncbi:hypothetical protein GCM10022252_75020 [Streptosporangium oxazolinicum]|uniref:Uncharacterized protein n=2 Tax=Streptosporangium oxazolinicum TaxID=909287 RepID=A0ABP8BKM2_9ACTN
MGEVRPDALLRSTRKLFPPPGPEQVEAFRAAVEGAILGWCLGEKWAAAVALHVATDYGPDLILAAALANAGIADRSPVGPLPIKTRMWVRPGQVQVSYGYGGAITALELEAAP